MKTACVHYFECRSWAETMHCFECVILGVQVFTYISLKTKGNNYMCPTKGAENGHFLAEHRFSRQKRCTVLNVVHSCTIFIVGLKRCTVFNVVARVILGVQVEYINP